MESDSYNLSFDGKLLQRGFWLYVWEITLPDGCQVYYVGRTGDSASVNAQSPFNRMGQHLGFNKNANVLRRRLEKEGVVAEECKFRMVAHGIILEEADNWNDHQERRDVVAALEKSLADTLAGAGYNVLNTVHCRQPLDEILWAMVRAEFARDFPMLGKATLSNGRGEL